MVTGRGVNDVGLLGRPIDVVSLGRVLVIPRALVTPTGAPGDASQRVLDHACKRDEP